MEPENRPLERKIIFQTIIFRFYVNLSLFMELTKPLGFSVGGSQVVLLGTKGPKLPYLEDRLPLSFKWLVEGVYTNHIIYN